MATEVRRTRLEQGYRRGRGTLEQRFEFRGKGADAEAIAEVFLTAPLVGDDSIFGDRPGREGARSYGARTLHGFSPAPGFRFDVELTRRGDIFVVRFAQPDRAAPYLQGELAWILSDTDDGPVLDEQINTERAMEIVSEWLGGVPGSLRRWLFFKKGHQHVMHGATRNIATLLDHPASN